MYAEPLARLIEELSKMPTVGPKTAQRLAFYILRMPKEDAERLSQAILDAKSKIRYCSNCFHITDVDPCAICTNASRTHSIICVVEAPGTVWALHRPAGHGGRTPGPPARPHPWREVGPAD